MNYVIFAALLQSLHCMADDLANIQFIEELITFIALLLCNDFTQIAQWTELKY